MNWDAIGAIGEVVGAVAVVATLIYLSLQVRSAHRDAQTSNFHRVADSFNDLNRMVASDPDLASLFNKGMMDFDALDDTERTQFSMLMLTACRIYDSLYYQLQRGVGDKELWSTEVETLKGLCSAPGFQSWWAANTFKFSPGFTKFINSIIDNREELAN